MRKFTELRRDFTGQQSVTFAVQLKFYTAESTTQVMRRILLPTITVFLSFDRFSKYASFTAITGPLAFTLLVRQWGVQLQKIVPHPTKQD